MVKTWYWHECISCGARQNPDKFYYTCPACGSLLLIRRDDEALKTKLGTGKKLQTYFDALRFGPRRQTYPNDSGVWLWRDFILPGFSEEDVISLKEGQTDLFEIPGWLKQEIGLDNLFIKLEGQAPSESFKDRGMPVAVSDALRLKRAHPELGIRGICCASTGDTSAAAAIYAAYCRDELDCLVLVPASKISDSQLFQAMAHGAQVRAIESVDGFDGCMRLIQAFTSKHPEYVLVNSKNDMRVTGQESIALEILQDLQWRAPDWISIPVGNAGNLTALLHSLLRARDFGLIDKLPGIIGAQTAAADTLVRWQQSGFKTYKPGAYRDTVASAMNINDPVSFPRVQKLYNQFDLHFYKSDEPETLQTWAQFTRAGAAICPQGAVALRSVLKAKADKVIKASDVVVSISTASMLKFTGSGLEHHMAGGNNDFSNPYQSVGDTLTALETSL